MVGLDAEGGVAGAAVEPRRVSGGVKYLDSSISRFISWIVNCLWKKFLMVTISDGRFV